VVLRTSKRIIQSYEGKIKAIAPDAKLGIRGSVATGRRSSGGAFNPRHYDVDAFIISEKLSSQGTEWGHQVPGVKAIQNEIRRDMDASPCLKGRVKEGGLFGFKIFGPQAERGFRAEGAAIF
jgi:hypothetical protein